MSMEYDAIAQEYAQARERTDMGLEQLIHWMDSLPVAAKILDLGCGTGLPLTKEPEDNNFRVTALDASPRLLEISSKNLSFAQLICTPVQAYDFPEQAYDAVLSWGLLFLLNRDDQTELIANVGKTLKAEGSFLFTSPSIPCAWEDILSKQKSVSLGRETYIRLLEAAGMYLQWESEDAGQSHYYCAVKRDK